jgi:Rhodopirellula transposase DDE domain
VVSSGNRKSRDKQLDRATTAEVVIAYFQLFPLRIARSHRAFHNDAGGSNGWRLRLWKLELQKFADESTLTLSVCHFPPGTSKWNKVEHRLFSFISSNWRGEPLRDYETIVNLIAQTTTAKGLSVICRLDRRKYPTGRKVTARGDETGESPS